VLCGVGLVDERDRREPQQLVAQRALTEQYFV
jgi:hypothetical protein